MTFRDTRFSVSPPEELGQQLDDWILRNLDTALTLKFPDAVIPYMAYPTEDIPVHCLVQVKSGRNCVKANASTGIFATDIVVGHISDRVPVVAPMANINISLGMQDVPGDFYPLFCGDGGTISTTVPTTGTVQRIGVALHWDEAKPNTFCRLQPAILGGSS